MEKDIVPSRFRKNENPPDESPAGTSPKVKTADAESVELVTVRFANGNAFHYNAGTIVEDDSAYRIYDKEPKAGGVLVAIVSKRGGFVVEASDPYAIELQGGELPPDTGTQGGEATAKPGFFARLFGFDNSAPAIPTNKPPFI